MKNLSSRLSHDLSDRILIGCFAPVVMLVTGIIVAFAYTWKPRSVVDKVVDVLLFEAFFAAFCLCGLAFIWAIATPRWIEKLTLDHAARTIVSLVLFGVGLCAALAVVLVLG
ncbi:MAG: hypothetical protein AB1696_21005 [Planctomycetota bacterium]